MQTFMKGIEREGILKAFQVHPQAGGVWRILHENTVSIVLLGLIDRAEQQLLYFNYFLFGGNPLWIGALPISGYQALLRCHGKLTQCIQQHLLGNHHMGDIPPDIVIEPLGDPCQLFARGLLQDLGQYFTVLPVRIE